MHLKNDQLAKKVECSFSGSLNIIRIAKLFQLDPNSVELDGISKDFHPSTGYTTAPVLGGSEDDPIIVTGQPTAGKQHSTSPFISCSSV